MEAGTEDGVWSGLERLRPTLERFLRRRCRNEAEVEDVIQETYLRAARYRTSLLEEAQLRPWAMRIAVNVLADRLGRERHLRRVALGDDVLEGIPAREPAVDVVDEELRLGSWLVDRDDALRYLGDALEGLRTEDRRVLDSYYGGSCSCRETARECALPPQLVKVRLFRARRRLLRAMRRRIAMEGRPRVEEGPWSEG